MSFELARKTIQEGIVDVFERLPRIEGGNVYALYRYDSSVMDAMVVLSDKYKTLFKGILSLPAYFKNFEDGDLFIKQISSAPMIDIKRSIFKIKAMKNGWNVRKADDYFVFTWGILYLKYETYSFGYLSEKIYTGEPSRDNRTCRFCQKSGADRFKELSHAIQDGLGNKILFCYEECDECNHYFEKHVEWHLYKILEINRTLSNVTGKSSRNHHLEGHNFCIHPDTKTLKPIVYVKQNQIINDLYRGKVTDKIYLYNKGEITLQGVYKALLKIALDMIPDKKKCHFIQTGKFVRGDIEAQNLPPVLFGEHNDFFAQPVVDLFFKNESSPKYSPFCTAVLYIFDSIFIYIVPLNDVDGNKYEKSAVPMLHWEFLKKHQFLNVDEWEEFDANDKEPKSPMYKIPVLGREEKYTVMYRHPDDDVFKRKK